eukprot:4950257-Amphidinium_carterae.1
MSCCPSCLVVIFPWWFHFLHWRLAVYVGKPPGGNLTLLHVAGVKPVPPSGPTTTEAVPSCSSR